MEILVYLLKSTVILSLFFAVYELFLKRETFFTLNRFFLLLGVLIAFSLPAITYTKTIVSEKIVFAAAQTSSEVFSDFEMMTTSGAVEKESYFAVLQPIHLVGILYALGCLFFLGKLLFSIVRLRQILRYRPKTYKKSGIRYIETDYPTNPFTFFNFVVYNPNKFDSSELQMMLHHEKVHSKNQHSIDILFGQLMLVFHWFNPIAWLYNKRIDQNLEFIADAETADIAIEKKTYQLSLLKTAYSGPLPLPVNNFHSFTKIRILMLNQTKSKRRNSLKVLFVLPLLATFFMSFQIKTVQKTVVAQEVKIDKDSIADKDVEALNTIFTKYDPEAIVNFNGKELKIEEIPGGFYRVEEVTLSDTQNPILRAKFEDHNMELAIDQLREGLYLYVRDNGIVVVAKGDKPQTNRINVYKSKNTTVSKEKLRIDREDENITIIENSRTRNAIKNAETEVGQDDALDSLLARLDGETREIVEDALKERDLALEESKRIVEESRIIRENALAEAGVHQLEIDKKREKILKERETMVRERRKSMHDRMTDRDSIREERMQARQEMRQEREQARQRMADFSEVENVKTISESGMSYQKAKKNDGTIEALRFVLDKTTTDAQLEVMKQQFSEMGITFKVKSVKRNAAGEITDIKMTLDNGKGTNNQVSQQGSSEGIKTYVLGAKSDNKIFILQQK